MSEPVPVSSPLLTLEQKLEFLRRRRARNYVLLAALVGLCLIIYGITLVKLHEYGPLW